MKNPDWRTTNGHPRNLTLHPKARPHTRGWALGQTCSLGGEVANLFEDEVASFHTSLEARATAETEKERVVGAGSQPPTLHKVLRELGTPRKMGTVQETGKLTLGEAG